jgi:hypothetical protein
METICFNIIRQPSLLFSAEEIDCYLFFSIFNRHVIVGLLLLDYFSSRVVGTCQTCYRYLVPEPVSCTSIRFDRVTHVTEKLPILAGDLTAGDT